MAAVQAIIWTSQIPGWEVGEIHGQFGEKKSKSKACGQKAKLFPFQGAAAGPGEPVCRQSPCLVLMSRALRIGLHLPQSLTRFCGWDGASLVTWPCCFPGGKDWQECLAIFPLIFPILVRNNVTCTRVCVNVHLQEKYNLAGGALPIKGGT